MKNKSVLYILALLAAICIFQIILPVHAVVRSFDNDVRTVFMTSVMTDANDQLFTVTGGRVEIISFFGECTTVISSSPGDLTINLDAAAGANYDRDFSTTVTIDSLGVGDIVRFSNAMDEGVLDLTANVGAGQTLSWFCPEGMIEQTLAEAGTGTIIWYMSYRRLDRAARVIAQ